MQTGLNSHNDLPREEIAADCLVQLTIKKYSPRKALKTLGIIDKSIEYPAVFALVTEVVRRDNTLKRIANSIILDIFTNEPRFNSSLKFFPLFVQKLIIIGTYRTILEDPLQKFPLVTSCIINIVKRRNFQQWLKYIKKFFHELEKFDFLKWVSHIKDPLDRIVIETSMPTWLTRSLLKNSDYEEVKDILSYLNYQPPIYIRLNSLKDKEVVFQELKENNIQYTEDPNFSNIFRIKYLGKARLPNLNSYKKGHFFIQSRTSAYIPLIIDPSPEDIILDTCASPGGKTTLLADLMGNNGKIYAFEVNKERFNELNKNISKFNVKNVESQCADIRTITDLEQQDIIMIDAPCSGTGTLASRPYIKWLLSKQKIKFYSKLQLEIITSASKFLKPETGRLYYITCSLLPEENEDIIKLFLESTNENFVPIPLKYKFGRSLPYNGQRLLPHIMESEGFTIFCLKRLK
ncbi:MAG: tRNA (cytosine(48)-C(5))-methyltransferase [Candidatus Heimdallarchaeota archaeon LC_3]|nr:MAG: tRNA (cytosine(48)-C(5))-methyltransferase [Candidatus Heimdallarchaeota archaeon LC_3]